MFSFLKDHPFAVEAFFESSIVLTFAVPKEQLENLIPPCLELDTFKEQWAFVAMAMVQTTGLRPKGFPRFMGNDFFLTGFRIFTKYTNNAGKRLRGLYIIKSETDKKKMEIMGNIFTHYKYSTTDIQQIKQGHRSIIKSNQSDFEISLQISGEETPLPAHSPFADWKEARRYAGPLPFTFTYEAATKKVLIIEGVRQNWTPKPIEVAHYHISFIDQLNLKGIVLANAFIIQDIPYYWKKGKKEIWNG